MQTILKRFQQLCWQTDGSVALIFGIALIPIMTGVGAAIDYSRANSVKASLQAALDSALLAGAKDASSNWVQVAQNVFAANLALKNISASTPTFTSPADSTYSGTVTASVPTSVLGMISIRSLNVGATGTAQKSEGDNSCILTLDEGQPSSHVSLTLNGAPIVNLSGCSLRSNTSMDCNGHDGSLTKSYARGAVASCGNPRSNSPAVPDIYAGMASNITTSCGTSGGGVSWTPGTLPTGPNFKTINKGTYTEYHVCGDLSVSGSGVLTGGAQDSVIVIENGSLLVNDQANISAARTAIVMTGDNNYAAKVDFPNGTGKSATLSLSPPTDAANPWQAVALYMDPKLTKNVDNTWGPGATFNADGLVYMGKSNVVTDGDTASANSKCTKFVMKTFTTNGHVDLDFAQSNCAAVGLKQWTGITVHLTR
jgi:type II secretory pathway pseudopilin PulG